jgi:CheY-like chemotaxis protein
VADDVTILLMSTHPPLNPAPVSSMLSDADRRTAGQHIRVLAQLVAASNPHAQTWVAQHAEQLEKGWPHLRAGLVAAIDQFDWARAETLLANFGCTTDTVWPATPVPQRHTVLVVDDNPVNLALMVDLLSPLYEVRATLSGARALHIARVQRVDLVLLDVMMPIMDGHEVCKRLQALPEMAHCPILFLTAQNQIKDTEYGLALGAQDYIAKPISPPLVLKRIETHLALQAFRRQAGQADPAFLAGDSRAVPASAR